MKGACRIWEHPKRAQIDAARLLGKPFRAVASEFSIPRATLHRHLKRYRRGAAERTLTRVGASYARHLQLFMRQSPETTLAVMKAAQARGGAEEVFKAGRAVRTKVDVIRNLLSRSAEPRASPK